MQKAHLYKAILLINREIDDAVRGLERLKRSKDSGLTARYIREVDLFEMHRALFNGFFCNTVKPTRNLDDLLVVGETSPAGRFKRDD